MQSGANANAHISGILWAHCLSQDYTPLQYPATHSLETPADSTVIRLNIGSIGQRWASYSGQVSHTLLVKTHTLVTLMRLLIDLHTFIYLSTYGQPDYSSLDDEGG